MFTVIPFYGGKYKISRYLVSILPEHDKYIEVFAGGLSMFFRKRKAEWSCINDINKDLINLYVCISDEKRLNKLVEKAYWIPKSRAFFDITKYTLGKTFSIPDTDRAFAYYYFIKNSFNNRMDTAFSKDITGWVHSQITGLRLAREKLDGVIPYDAYSIAYENRKNDLPVEKEEK